MKVIELEVVAALAEALCQRIGEPRYQLWFHDKTKFSWDQDRLVVGVPNRFFQEWLQRTFVRDVEETASTLMGGEPVRVSFVIDPQLFQAFRLQEAAERAGPGLPAGLPGSFVQTAVPGPRLPSEGTAPGTSSRRRAIHLAHGENGTADVDGCDAAEAVQERGPNHEPRKARSRRWRRLEDFVVGPSNRVAHASALSIAETPGQGPNPLVLHGPVGVGKTHLLEGIYLMLRRRQPEERVMWLTAEDFTNRFVQAMRHGKLAAFRKQFREADALLVDDVHFLAKKLATQEEFLHTFDALHLAERPVVMTCDCHPRLAEQFMPELTDRLLGGAIWSVNLPEKETRLALLKSKRLLSRAEPLSEAVVEFLAEKLRGNVREIEGALHTLDHFARVTARPITVELAREALAEVLRHCVRVVQIEDVERTVCHTLGLDKGALRNSQRGWMFSHPRMLAVFLARKHTGATYTEIGQYLGKRSHSTAVAAEKKVREWLRDDSSLSLGQQRLRVRDVVEKIERELLR